MLTPTTTTEFNPKTDLPEWAQDSYSIKFWCERDLAFRCDVIRAETAHYQNHLRSQAENRMDDYAAEKAREDLR